VGQPYYDAEMARYFVIIQAAVPAQEAEGSSVHLQFTPETWSYISGILEEDYPQQAIVGWYHSHPGLGIFMSGTDQATQRAFYNHPWCLAVVVDPIKQKTGWFIGEDSQPLHRQYVIPYEVAAEAPADQAEKDASSLEQEYWETLSLQRYDWLLPFGFLALGLAFLLWWLGRARVSGGWV
jgi:proteasome lid subunit RPN8/RPN11